MCEFVSWEVFKNEVYFLQNSDLETKEGKELLKPYIVDDLCGHGAIENYYPELKGKGEHKECTDFSKPSNFPLQIVKAIKEGRLSRIGICLDVLNANGKEQYNKIKAPALEQYNKIKAQAWEQYNKIQAQAWEQYNKIEVQAWEQYNKIRAQALEQYNKIQAPALEQYNKIRAQAWEQYNKIKAQTFAKIIKQKKYRNDNWK